MNVARRKSVKMTLPEDSTVEYDEIDILPTEEEGDTTTTTLASTAVPLRSTPREEQTPFKNNNNNDGNLESANIGFADVASITRNKREVNNTGTDIPCSKGETNTFYGIDDVDAGSRDNNEKTVWRKIQNFDEQKPKQQQKQQQQRTRKRGQILQTQSLNSFSHGDLRSINSNNHPHNHNHLRSSTENLHLSNKNTVTNIQHRNNSFHQPPSSRRTSVPNIYNNTKNNSKSLPTSLLMSPRLIPRRAQEQGTTSFIPCPPPDSPSTMRKKRSPRRSSNVGLRPIEQRNDNKNNDDDNNNNNNNNNHDSQPRRSSNVGLRHIEQQDHNINQWENNNELYCAEDEEIRVLNLSSPTTPTPPEKLLPNQHYNHRLKDDLLLKYALRRIQSVKSLPNVPLQPLSPSPSQQHQRAADRSSSTTPTQQRRTSNAKRLERSRSAVSLPNSPPETPTSFTHQDPMTRQYLANRRRTVALDKGIQLRKTFQEWLECKTEDNRRRSLNTIHAKELERLRDEQSRHDRFLKAKTYTEWKSDKEDQLRHQLEEEREKTKVESVKHSQKEREAEELRVKKYNEWLVKKFQAELAEEERKIDELRNREKLKKKNVGNESDIKEEKTRTADNEQKNIIRRNSK